MWDIGALDECRLCERLVPFRLENKRIYTNYRCIVPLKIVVSLGEIDVFLVKDGCPLKGCGYKACCQCFKPDLR